EAKDFDDAVSAQPEDGGVRLWVHIADVSAYVRPDSVLEHEAFRRATSVYVPGAVEPMLPEALSNEACSLVPDADRLAVTVEMRMEGPDVRSVAFHRTLIRSDARLTYPQVDRVFAREEQAGEAWAGPLEAARAIAAALRARRDELGSLEVPTPPVPRHMSPQQAADLVAEISHAVADYVRSSGRGREAFSPLVLRALKQAYYSPRNLGHAGLASRRYCHFTSPIRRY